MLTEGSILTRAIIYAESADALHYWSCRGGRLRRTTFRAGKPSLEIVMTVSADGNTMTVTTHTPDSSDEPSLFVYEKQN